MPLTIVCKYPGSLNEEAQGPELPSPRSAAPRSGAGLHLRRSSTQAPPTERVPRFPGLVQFGLSWGSLTLGASRNILEGQREQTATRKVVGRGRDLREVSSSGGGDRAQGKGLQMVESPDTGGRA